MSKKIALILVAVMTIAGIAITGCTPQPTTPTVPTTPTAPTTPTTPTTPSQPAPQAINWIGQSALPSGNPPTEGLERLCASIKAASDGQLLLKSNPAGAVVPGTEEWKNIDSGVLDFCAGGGSYMAQDLRFGTALSQLPAGMPPLPNLIFHKAIGADIMNKWYKDKGWKIYDIPGGGFHGLPEIWISTSKPISGPENLRGLKMRTAGDCGAVLETMGVGTVFMPLGELFEAMQRGVVDAFEASCPAFNYSMGMHEACKYNYLSPSRAPTEVYAFLVSIDKFNALPNHLQAVVAECAAAEAIKYNEMLHTRNAVALKAMADYGNINLPLPASIDEAFVAATKAFYKAEVEKFPELKDYLTQYMAFAKNWEELYGFPYKVMTSFD